MAENLKLREETVVLLLLTTKELLASEESREQSLIGRGSGVAAFAGLIVALLGSLSSAVVTSHLPMNWEQTCLGLLAGALASLLATVLIVVFGVLYPRASAGLAISEIRRFPTWEFITQERVSIAGRMMRGNVASIAVERQKNGRKAEWLGRSFLSFSFALTSLATLGVILGAHALKLI
jgi:hypothetical protein